VTTPASTSLSPSATVAVDIAPTITAGLTLAGDIVKLTDDELAFLNSPTMVQARKNVALQQDKDRAHQDAVDALKSGDASKVDADLS